MYLQRWINLFFPLLLLVGCTNNHAKEIKSSSPQSMGKAVDSNILVSPNPRDEWEAEIGLVDSVSVLTKGGYEISVNVQQFKDKFRKFPQWKKESVYLGDFDYTVLIGSKASQPRVMSISAVGVQWENAFYTGEGANQMVSFIKESVGKGFFQGLSTEHILVNSKDLESSRQISGDPAKSVLDMLRESSLIDGNPRLQYPLFPYYTLEFERGKEMVQAEILSPTLVAVKIGQEKLYFQTKDSLYSPLKSQFSIMDYTDQNIKYLFKATDIQVVLDLESSPIRKLGINREKVSDIEAQSIIHNIVRNLIQGKKDEGKRKTNTGGLTLIFSIGDARIPIKINSDSFEYQRNLYLKSGILSDLSELVKKEEMFKEIR